MGFGFSLITWVFINKTTKYFGIAFFMIVPLSIIFCEVITLKMGPLRFFKIGQNLGAEQTAWGKMGQIEGLNGTGQIFKNNL